ncbi:uncharacterized protein LOC129220688 [Uloborus diversus]|uniref:uncharacterized protein LOC129220688 n=1 Tax=Uloborus diversus TaxID=327109 RepID=UPI00240A2E49|nr:uncharacterized protein LOC129220688 [Uloborus diversus]
MDEALNKELPNHEASVLSNSTSNEDTQSTSVSPERQTMSVPSNMSPNLSDVHTENRRNSSDDNDDDRNGNRDVNDGFLDAEEVMMQRHAMLNSAMVSQESESAFSCKFPGCNFNSTDVEMYLKHEDTHIDGGSVVCDVCNIRFATYASMRRHRLLHLGVRPFECQTCSKRFLRKEQFTEHVLRHSKHRPSMRSKDYRCPFCNRSFSFRPHLKSHLTSEHAGIVLDKTCHLCDFKASSPNGAKIHFAMCHLKQSSGTESDNDRSQEPIRSSQVPVSATENGAIDLATVSQNFTFIQAAHYPSYSISSGDSNVAVPGPSDLSRTASKVIRMATPAPGPTAVVPSTIEQSVGMPLVDEDRHACVSALAGSTTVVSPPTICQDKSCCRPDVPHHELPPRERICVKPEPSELAVDDSQSSNVQPTSTMDLSTTDVVGTTSMCNEASGSSEIPCRRKFHKHSSGDDSSESHNSPTNRFDSHGAQVSNLRIAHTCFRYRGQCEEHGNRRCPEYSRHTCGSHRHSSEKRPRLSESEGDRNVQNDHSDCEERKVFYNRATSTNALIQTDLPMPRTVHQGTAMHSSTVACASEPRVDPAFFGRKSTIVIRDIESCTLTCPYCGIIFPDQTLYLLHRSLHSETSPWKCNLCGKSCKDKYDFNSHIISKGHY